MSNHIDMRPYAIILALDLPSSDEVLSCAKEVGDIIDGIKVGVTTLLESGINILGRLRGCIGDKPLLVDLQNSGHRVHFRRRLEWNQFQNNWSFEGYRGYSCHCARIPRSGVNRRNGENRKTYRNRRIAAANDEPFSSRTFFLKRGVLSSNCHAQSMIRVLIPISRANSRFQTSQKPSWFLARRSVSMAISGRPPDLMI